MRLGLTVKLLGSPDLLRLNVSFWVSAKCLPYLNHQTLTHFVSLGIKPSAQSSYQEKKRDRSTPQNRTPSERET